MYKNFKTLKINSPIKQTGFLAVLIINIKKERKPFPDILLHLI